MTQVPCELVSGGSKVAGTHAIAAPGASYAVDFSQLMKNAELLPPAAAGCTAGKIDEHREDESHRLRRQPVHGSGAAPEEDRAPLSGGVNRPESEVGDHSRIPLVHFRLFEQLKRRNVFRVAALYLVQRPLDFLEARLLSQRVEPRVYLQIR